MTMPARRPLVRQKLTIHHEHGAMNLYVDIDTLDKQPREIFIAIEKTGADVRAYVDALARMASKALQIGLPFEEVIDSWRHTKMSPYGPVSECEGVRFCTSPLDAVAQYLEQYTTASPPASPAQPPA